MNISLEDFKRLVINDFATALMGSEARRLAELESRCHNITFASDIAQMSLAKFIGPDDIYISTGIDLTVEFARRRLTPASFFKKMYSSAYDAFDLAYVGNMPVAAGAAMAQKQSADKSGIVICTAGVGFAADGCFFETLYCATEQQLPLAVVVWNNDGGHTNGNLIKLLSGFTGMRRGTQALSIQAVKGNDYSALCHTFERQLAHTRDYRAASLTFVEGCLENTEPMARWITEKQIATPQRLREIEQEVKQQVERDRKGEYYKSLVGDAPVKQTVRTLDRLSDIVSRADVRATLVSDMPNSVDKAIGLALKGLRPVVEADCRQIAASTLDRNDSLPVVVRTTDSDFGRLLSTAMKTMLCTPCCRRQADELYSYLISNGLQSIVVEAGGNAAVGKFSRLMPGYVHTEVVGTDITLLCYGASVEPAIDAAKMLASENVQVEVIDACSLRPFDVDFQVSASLSKTHRLLIAAPDAEGASAHFLLGEMAIRDTALTSLDSKPVVIAPKGQLTTVLAADICTTIKNILQR